MGHVSAGGYGTVTFYGRTTGAHRVAFVLANGPIDRGVIVRHTCDNPSCVNPAHLEIGTPLDNMRDKIERGRDRFQRGSEHHAAILTEDLAADIYTLRKQGAAGRDLADAFGVSEQAVCDIISGRRWLSAFGGQA